MLLKGRKLSVGSVYNSQNYKNRELGRTGPYLFSHWSDAKEVPFLKASFHFWSCQQVKNQSRFECCQMGSSTVYIFWNSDPFFACWHGRKIHGLQTPDKAFFQWYPKFLGLSKQIGLINFWAFVVFSCQTIDPFLAMWVPCPWENGFDWFSYIFLVFRTT